MVPAHLGGKISFYDIAELVEELEALSGVDVDFNIANDCQAIFGALFQLNNSKPKRWTLSVFLWESARD